MSKLFYIFVICIIGFVLLSWSVNNPSEAKTFRDDCVNTAKVFVSDVNNYFNEEN